MVGSWGPGVVGGPIYGYKMFGYGWSMTSLIFQHIMNIYDVTLWRHIC